MSTFEARQPRRGNKPPADPIGTMRSTSSSSGAMPRVPTRRHLAPSGVPTLTDSPNQPAFGSDGRPLDPQVRAAMEPRLGHDFGAVRVHSDATAAASAHDLGAAAYTVGQHIVFGADRYRPETLAGGRLLAHALSHVVQNAVAGTDH